MCFPERSCRNNNIFVVSNDFTGSFNDNMKRVFPILMSMMALLTAMSVKANDGSFKVNGNTLVPLQETDISIAKEVLTITIGDYDTVNYVRYATVDVYYEFFNPGGEKTITMAFEAEAPDTWQREPLNRNGVHPFMKDFTVEMNGAAVKHENAVVEKNYGKEQDFKRVDLTQWKGIGDDINYKGEIISGLEDEPFMGADDLYSEKLDSFAHFAYGYFFTAKFKKGKNTVHHTYRYRTSDFVYATFELPYWLTPAMRWAGGKIGDFTLRLLAESKGTAISMNTGLFQGEPWRGIGPVYEYVSGDGHDYEGLVTDDASPSMVTFLDNEKPLEWHSGNFVPEKNIYIFGFPTSYYDWTDVDVVVDHSDGSIYPYHGQDKRRYLVDVQNDRWIDKSVSHIEKVRINEHLTDVTPDMIQKCAKEQLRMPVDLGLSVKWAGWNIGADKPESFGDYFDWGNYWPKKSYSENNYYNSGHLDHDAAKHRWGGSWRMPTSDECQELKDKCKWEWTTVNGVNGYKVTGPSGKSIFLPAAGMRLAEDLLYSGKNGYYWSSSIYESDKSQSWQLFFIDTDRSGVGPLKSFVGRSVRAVCE